jgi:hypothetical protein
VRVGLQSAPHVPVPSPETRGQVPNLHQERTRDRAPQVLGVALELAGDLLGAAREVPQGEASLEADAALARERYPAARLGLRREQGQ